MTHLATRQAGKGSILSTCWQMPACMLSHVRLFAALWTVTCQVPLSMEFSSQDYWSGLLSPPPGDLPYPGIESTSLVFFALQAYSLWTETLGKTCQQGTDLKLRAL